MAGLFTFKGRYERAFTLLEMSIVLVIIAVIVGSGMTVLAVSLQKRQLADTQYKLKVLQKSLLDYRTAMNRIPCPGDLAQTNTAANFGVEAANKGSCTGGAPAATFTNGNFAEGMVPVKTLNLPDDFAYDGWGRRIAYAVDIRFTASSAFTSITANDATARMTIKDESGNNNATTAGYVLISFGPNGHGAYPRSSSTRISTGSTNTDELNNCDCSSATPPAATGLDGVFVQKEATQDSATANRTNDFDDVVVYGTRSDLRLPTE